MQCPKVKNWRLDWDKSPSDKKRALIFHAAAVMYWLIKMSILETRNLTDEKKSRWVASFIDQRKSKACYFLEVRPLARPNNTRGEYFGPSQTRNIYTIEISIGVEISTEREFTLNFFVCGPISTQFFSAES